MGGTLYSGGSYLIIRSCTLYSSKRYVMLRWVVPYVLMGSTLFLEGGTYIRIDGTSICFNFDLLNSQASIGQSWLLCTQSQ